MDEGPCFYFTTSSNLYFLLLFLSSTSVCPPHHIYFFFPLPPHAVFFIYTTSLVLFFVYLSSLTSRSSVTILPFPSLFTLSPHTSTSRNSSPPGEKLITCPSFLPRRHYCFPFFPCFFFLFGCQQIFSFSLFLSWVQYIFFSSECAKFPLFLFAF